MKSVLLVLASLFAVSANAAYYCKLENVPAVKEALKQALQDVDATKLSAAPTGEIVQTTISSFGDGNDYAGTDLLLYKLDKEALDNVQVVAVTVSYNAIKAKEAAAGDPAAIFECIDTHEINPEIIYVDGEHANDEAIVAAPVKF